VTLGSKTLSLIWLKESWTNSSKFHKASVSEDIKTPSSQISFVSDDYAVLIHSVKRYGAIEAVNKGHFVWHSRGMSLPMYILDAFVLI